MDFASVSLGSLLAKEPREKHMLEVEESCQAVSFMSVSREVLTRETLYLEDFFYSNLSKCKTRVNEAQ